MKSSRNLCTTCTQNWKQLFYANSLVTADCTSALACFKVYTCSLPLHFTPHSA